MIQLSADVMTRGQPVANRSRGLANPPLRQVVHKFRYTVCEDLSIIPHVLSTDMYVKRQ